MNLDSFNSMRFNLVIDLNESNFMTKAPVFYPSSHSRVQWTTEENDQLLNHVKKYGPKYWKQIAAEIKTKNAQQCRYHYNDVLDPKINNAIWTREEEKTLMLKYEQLGPHWSKIREFLPGRTTGMIKNYMNILINNGIYNEENIKHLKKGFTNDVIEKTKDFSKYNIESLLNHPSDC